MYDIGNAISSYGRDQLRDLIEQVVTDPETATTEQIRRVAQYAMGTLPQSAGAE